MLCSFVKHASVYIPHIVPHTRLYIWLCEAGSYDVRLGNELGGSCFLLDLHALAGQGGRMVSL